MMRLADYSLWAFGDYIVDVRGMVQLDAQDNCEY